MILTEVIQMPRRMFSPCQVRNIFKKKAGGMRNDEIARSMSRIIGQRVSTAAINLILCRYRYDYVEIEPDVLKAAEAQKWKNYKPRKKKKTREGCAGQ